MQIDTSKTVFITGAASGIGLSVAKRFLKLGFNVVVFDCNKDKIDSRIKSLEVKEEKLLAICGDVSNVQNVKDAVRSSIQKFGRIDILVSNAGIQTVHDLYDLPDEEWLRVLDVNLNGTYYLCKYISEQMVKNKWYNGKIINVVSVHYNVPRLNKFHYDASKAGIAIFTKELALRLAQYGINVNGIAPGAFKTDMNEDIISDSQKIEETVKRIPMGRMGEPEEATDLIEFLVSEKAKYITGEIINIDGGRGLI